MWTSEEKLTAALRYCFKWNKPLTVAATIKEMTSNVTFFFIQPPHPGRQDLHVLHHVKTGPPTVHHQELDARGNNLFRLLSA